MAKSPPITHADLTPRQRAIIDQAKPRPTTRLRDGLLPHLFYAALAGVIVAGIGGGLAGILAALWTFIGWELGRRWTHDRMMENRMKLLKAASQFKGDAQ